jgi:hypothetical protein
MSNRLVNVRVDEEHLRKARRLRSGGIVLSDLIREAIDTQYERLVRSGGNRDVEAIMKEIYDRYPDPPGLPPREYNVADRVAARKAIRNKLRKKEK